ARRLGATVLRDAAPSHGEATSVVDHASEAVRHPARIGSELDRGAQLVARHETAMEGVARLPEDDDRVGPRRERGRTGGVARDLQASANGLTRGIVAA